MTGAQNTQTRKSEEKIMRRIEVISRRDYEAMLGHMDGDQQQQLPDDLDVWAGGDVCEWVEVSLDSLGRLDTESSPRPVAQPPNQEPETP